MIESKMTIEEIKTLARLQEKWLGVYDNLISPRDRAGLPKTAMEPKNALLLITNVIKKQVDGHQEVVNQWSDSNKLQEFVEELANAYAGDGDETSVHFREGMQRFRNLMLEMKISQAYTAENFIADIKKHRTIKE